MYNDGIIVFLMSDFKKTLKIKLINAGNTVSNQSR
jgi:hypothetical protein